MDSFDVNGISFTGNACRRVTATWNGKRFTAGERTWAHLFYTQDYLDRHYPNYYIYVLQGAFNTGVKLSAGTHDKDGTIDCLIIDRRTGERIWKQGQKILRICGWAAWWRHTGSWAKASAWHHHMNSLGTLETGCQVGIFIPGQNRDYLAKPPRNGLAGHDADPTWHPKDIEATVFDYQQWLTKGRLMAKLDADDLIQVRKIVREELDRSWNSIQANGRRRQGNLLAIAQATGVLPVKKAVEKK
jgi:hypothetical protein